MIATPWRDHMFDMAKKKKDNANWEFDLEKELSDPAKKRKYKEQVDQSVNEIKNLLRQGIDKKTFDDAQTLLHGYLAIQKVLQRVGKK